MSCGKWDFKKRADKGKHGVIGSRKKVSASWFGVSLCFFLTALYTLLSLCYTN